jgi:hypothetical protein
MAGFAEEALKGLKVRSPIRRPKIARCQNFKFFIEIVFLNSSEITMAVNMAVLQTL